MPKKPDYSIAKLCLPAILSNITVPLLGLSDTAISGHIGSEIYIGAISVGTMMMNSLFWLFGFLRMGTTGMVAQAYGEMQVDHTSGRRHADIIFCRAALLGLAGALLLILLQTPLAKILLLYISPPQSIYSCARQYFSICIWGSPAILLTGVANGWFLGMQDTVRPMVISIATAMLNILLSILFVFIFGMGFVGVAWGTLIAGWSGLALALILIWKFNGRRLPLASLRMITAPGGIARFFRINSDIFLRTLFIMGVTLSVTAYSARLGTLTLAANTIIMQFFLIFSYFMDGLAFAAEALTGRFAGQKRRDLLRDAVKRIAWWSALTAVLFTVAYIFGHRIIASFITSEAQVVAEVCRYSIWLILIPGTTVAAFMMDGVYIGLTATRRLLLATVAATAVFFGIALLPGIITADPEWWPGNNLLWCAFLCYLLARGLILLLLYPRLTRLSCESILH